MCSCLATVQRLLRNTDLFLQRSQIPIGILDRNHRIDHLKPENIHSDALVLLRATQMYRSFDRRPNPFSSGWLTPSAKRVTEAGLKMQVFLRRGLSLAVQRQGVAGAGRKHLRIAGGECGRVSCHRRNARYHLGVQGRRNPIIAEVYVQTGIESCPQTRPAQLRRLR